jgi:glycosyltransferase involved in cell wall biosynthesis
LKVAYDHQAFTNQQFGGISRYFFELANRLSGADDGKVNCLVASPCYTNAYLRYAGLSLKISGVSVPRLPRTGRLYGAVNRVLAPLIVRSWNPNIVHETYYSRHSVAPRSCRIVLTVYDMIHELFPQCFSSTDRTSEFKKLAVDRADHIICISESTRQDLMRLLDVPSEKTSVVHLGFSLTQTSEQSSFATDRPFLLYVGSRGGYKNFDRLLAAFASSQELQDGFDLVAFGGGRFRASELGSISRLGLNNSRVRQVNGNDSVLAAAYKNAALFVYPSLYEGFGMPPLEAMSFGCPVACSNTSSLPEVVGTSAVQFDPFDVDSIADALLNVCTNSSLRSTLTSLGGSRVQEFGWDKCASQTLAVYRKVLE